MTGKKIPALPASYSAKFTTLHEGFDYIPLYSKSGPCYSFSEFFRSRHCHVEEKTKGEKVHKFNGAQSREPHAESHESPNVGEKVHKSIQLSSLLSHEVKVFEVHMYYSQVLLNVSVIQILLIFVY